MKSRIEGKVAFLEYYQNLFPETDEADSMFASLSRSTQPILRFNIKDSSTLQSQWQRLGLTWQTLSWFPTAVLWPPEAPLGTDLPGHSNHLIYAMNASSLLPALALDAQPGERILDACAAPGGKTLLIAETMQGQGELIANDSSPARRHRLQAVLSDYNQAWVTTQGKKAETIYQRQPNYFDRILLDAPCSSEKHVWNKPERLAQWTPARTKQLAQRQLALISGLFEAVKIGGRLVYATCAISRKEDEEVIARLLKKKKDRIALEPWPSHLPHGLPLPGSGLTAVEEASLCRILPHQLVQADNWDPMFIAIITRLA
ncbi:MAG: hypothetical protein COW24_04455 [Candidatus Kerfeldbacteria bacterium CG15_BIG_FIL_POST_REV_8_21_14_020_45_12]|uniref:SAM-dependent MTase RsmB/NOP-type domain-containing protein n=1 Tax=Candidatus Kerfeldbacteria bacterium CG15_BIG_FIL_POST_REV_8_21_14_020_45_12 TaxID=2014247 RepID=A0A2M7H2W8_9BACT|nr:MAG: hypothetical protein COW24_04455 [Candidatus Kerfeldbacteria bacterium CG15_BIG_FIL_POST_REV_8_21_14_020_45_12]PJA93344.1 MAG: hypothetical protein CO132_03230 [Candidatus Kerfeldbacteria bacterium CG_4_9_14_3_um_filter_45_8]